MNPSLPDRSIIETHAIKETGAMRTYDSPTESPSDRLPTPRFGGRRSVAIATVRILASLLLMTGGAIAPPASGGSITYQIINYPTLQNGYTVSGSITTDGNTGILNSNDITSYYVAISLNGVPVNGLDSPYSFSTTYDLYATTTSLTLLTGGELTFAFTGVKYPIFFIGWGTYDDELNLSDLYESTSIYPGTAGMEREIYWADAWTYVNTIASVPEPSAIALLTTGALGAVAFSVHGRSRHRRPHRRQSDA